MKDSKRRLYKQIIHGREWNRLREWYIVRHPFCEECLKRGIMDQPAEEVHHKTPIGTGHGFADMKRLAYDPNNLEAVCHECHKKIHKAMKTRSRRGGKGTSGEVAEWMEEMFGI